MDQVILCGDCKEWKPWDCPRIDTHRYGTCGRGKITTRRVDFCKYIDRSAIPDTTKRAPLTARQQQIWDLHQSGLSDSEVGQHLGITAAAVRRAIIVCEYKITGNGRYCPERQWREEYPTID